MTFRRKYSYEYRRIFKNVRNLLILEMIVCRFERIKFTKKANEDIIRQKESNVPKLFDKRQM